MQNALLPNGQTVNAYEYDPQIHGYEIFCYYCKAKVSHVGIGKRNDVPFFRTTGRNESIHEDYCPEKRQVKQIKTLKTLNNYTVDINKINISDFHVIKVDFGYNDITHMPHGEISEISKNNPKKKLNYTLSYSNRKNCLVEKITSLATIAKLLQKNTPKQLSKIALDISGKMTLVNQLVIDQNQAYEIAKSSNFYLPWFIIYGKVRSVVKLNKVMFINFDEQDGLKPFTAYIFSGHYKFFTYTKEQLEGKHVLLQGNIKFNERYNKTELQVILNKQLYLLN